MTAALTDPLVMWGHALAALLFGLLALWEGRRSDSALPRLSFIVALAMTSLWLLAVAGIDARDLVTRMAGGLRNLAWLAFMFAILRRGWSGRERLAVGTVYGVVMLVAGMAIVLDVVQEISASSAFVTTISDVRTVLRMTVAAGALVLVHHLHSVLVPGGRGGVRLILLALAMMFGSDLVLFSSAYVAGSLPPSVIAWRGGLLALAALLFAAALQRNGEWQLQLSRAFAWQSLLVAAVALYIGVTVVAMAALAAVGGANARIAQTAFIFGSTAAVLTLATSSWLRAWAKVVLAKHLFRHRYDYRAEWLRFTDTLGQPGEGAAPLAERLVKAIADLTDSPAGLLLVPDAASLTAGASWRWDLGDAGLGAEERLTEYLARTGRILELDAIRAGTAEPADAAAIPAWMIDRQIAWALVPLVHHGRLVGAVMLARPPIDRALDWEDFDLLRVAGRQAASILAEARAQEALGEAERFDEFNRRFAFILHDIKNLVSQLTLVARNAERHADNPAFRADMVATLNDSAGRMNDLLARLSQHNSVRPDIVQPVALAPILERVAGRRRAQHAIASGGVRDVQAMADPARLEQLLNHLVQNAIEASPNGEPVTLAAGTRDGCVTIDVIDHGCGMSPAFIRDRLFKPFVSSKAAGFGIGAFEARQLAHAMGGRIEVQSREGEGSRFRVILPGALPLEQAA